MVSTPRHHRYSLLKRSTSAMASENVVGSACRSPCTKRGIQSGGAARSSIAMACRSLCHLMARNFKTIIPHPTTGLDRHRKSDEESPQRVTIECKTKDHQHTQTKHYHTQKKNTTSCILQTYESNVNISKLCVALFVHLSDIASGCPAWHDYRVGHSNRVVKNSRTHT